MMKLYIRQIRPYHVCEWGEVRQELIIPGYDKWFPESEEDRLEQEISKLHYDYELEFEERYIEPLPCRCDKCVYEIHCPGKNTDINQTCHNYKRDAPDGGYYG